MFIIYVKGDDDFPPRFSQNPEQALKISKEIQIIVGPNRQVIVEKLVTKPFLSDVIESY